MVPTYTSIYIHAYPYTYFIYIHFHTHIHTCIPIYVLAHHNDLIYHPSTLFMLRHQLARITPGSANNPPSSEYRQCSSKPINFLIIHSKTDPFPSCCMLPSAAIDHTIANHPQLIILPPSITFQQTHTHIHIHAYANTHTHTCIRGSILNPLTNYHFSDPSSS